MNRTLPALLILALASAAGAAGDAASQPAISVPIRETVVFPLPATASVLVTDEKIVEVARGPDGLHLRGLERGETILFVGDGSETRVFTISVVNAAAVSTLGGALSRTEQMEKQLGISTGGWIRSGSIGLSEAVAASRGVYSRSLTLSLSGSTPDVNYSLIGSGLQYQQSIATADVDASASGSWGRARFGLVQQDSEFKPVLWGRPFREAALLLGPGDWNVGASARALYQFDRPSFDPEGWRGFAQRHWDSGATSSVGVVEGRSGDVTSWLPYAGGGYETNQLGAQAFVGRVAGAAAQVASAQAHASLGPCLITANYTTGLHGPDAAAQRSALLPYLDPGIDAFSSRGQCHAGQFVMGASAYRGGVPSPYIDTSAILTSGFASWREGNNASVSANVQWSLSGKDLRNYGTINADRRWGDYELSGTVLASRPTDEWSFNETATVRRYLGRGSIGLASGLSHMSGPPQSVWTSLDGAIENQYLRASLGGQASYSLAVSAPAYYQIVGQLELRPYSAYSLRAYSFADPRHLERWNFNLGFSYFFGDSQPREPMLRPFRSSNVEALAFEDRNGNGIRDPGEPALPGVKICVDRAQCGLTGADGRWSATSLDDGTHRVVADASSLEGAAPTNEPVGSPAAGSYRTPHLVFGFRYRAELIVHAFLDKNGNGKRDPGEDDFVTGKASIRGPDGAQALVPLANAHAEVFQKGDVAVSLDVASLPAGYMAENEVVFASVKEFSRVEMDFAVRPLRSLGGRVCLDQNGDGTCQSTELSVGLVHVSDGREEVVADEQGNFLFSDLPPGAYRIRVREEDLPAGSRQLKDLEATLSDGPSNATSLALPLKRDLQATRGYTISLAWPPYGAVKAREIGGLYLRSASLDAGGTPKANEQKELRSLVRAGRRTHSRFVIAVYSDATAYAKDPKAAQEHARASGAALARSLGLNDTNCSVEPRSPTDDEEMIDFRRYRRVE